MQHQIKGISDAGCSLLVQVNTLTALLCGLSDSIHALLILTDTRSKMSDDTLDNFIFLRSIFKNNLL
jgi:hypothetical protein